MSTCSRLNETTWSEEKRRKSSECAGLGSVTVRQGRSISSKERYSVLQNTVPHAALSAATSPYRAANHDRKARAAAGEWLTTAPKATLVHISLNNQAAGAMPITRAV
jgi:hypothetical protein